MLNLRDTGMAFPVSAGKRRNQIAMPEPQHFCRDKESIQGRGNLKIQERTASNCPIKDQEEIEWGRIKSTE